MQYAYPIMYNWLSCMLSAKTIINLIYFSEAGNTKMQHYMMIEKFKIAGSYYSVGPIFHQDYKAYCQLIKIMNLISLFFWVFFSFGYK